MAAMPKPTLVRCKECGQAVARITGKTIRPLGDISIRDGKIAVVCPACNARRYISRQHVEEAA